MRRSERAVTDREGLKEILDSCRVVRLGLHDGEEIYIVPLNFGYELAEDGALTLYMHGSKEGKKAELIRACGRAAFEMDCGHGLVEGETACRYSYTYASITGRGRVCLVEEPEEKKKALSLLMRCQTGRSFSFTDAMAASVAVIKLSVQAYTGKKRASAQSRDGKR